MQKVQDMESEQVFFFSSCSRFYKHAREEAAVKGNVQDEYRGAFLL